MISGHKGAVFLHIAAQVYAFIYLFIKEVFIKIYVSFDTYLTLPYTCTSSAAFKFKFRNFSGNSIFLLSFI